MTDRTQTHPLVFGLHMDVADPAYYIERGLMAINYRVAEINGPLPDAGFTPEEERRIFWNCIRNYGGPLDDGRWRRREPGPGQDSEKSRRGTVVNWVAGLKFAAGIRRGDIAVFRNPKYHRGDVVVGVVTGEHWECVSTSEPYGHRRRVDWRLTVPSEMLAVDGRGIVGYIASGKTIGPLNAVFWDRVMEALGGAGPVAVR